jgi:hypothetical protein
MKARVEVAAVIGVEALGPDARNNADSPIDQGEVTAAIHGDGRPRAVCASDADLDQGAVHIAGTAGKTLGIHAIVSVFPGNHEAPG